LVSLYAHAVQVVGEKLEIYGKAHISIDLSDQDNPAVTNDGLSVSSNSSRLGFKGKMPSGKLDFLYQYESELNLDAGGGNFTTRNSFLGLQGDFGRLIVGLHDTPFKLVGSKWGLFSDTVGDRRAILGSGYIDGNQLNERARNAILYTYNKDGLIVDAMYAVDPENTTTGSVDDNDTDVTSVDVRYKKDMLWLAFGYETWSGHSSAADVDAFRLAAKYKIKQYILGAIYENIDSDTVAQWQRDVIGVNAKMLLNEKTDLRVQYLLADDASGVADSGASVLAFGAFHQLENNLSLYGIFAMTNNDSAAQFKVADGGHGDEVSTIPGGDPSSLSFGMVYKF
jgi:hypothetical protein